MIFIVSALVSIILATPLLRNEGISPPLPAIPIIEMTIGVDNITKNRSLFLSASGILGSVVYDELCLYSDGIRIIDMKNVTTITYITQNRTLSMNITARVEKSVYFYAAVISVNYSAPPKDYILIIDEFPQIRSVAKTVKLTYDDLPYRQEAMEAK